MEAYVSSVATDCPRAAAVSTHSRSAAALYLHVCTSSGSMIPACAIAAVTASAVASICAMRPDFLGQEVPSDGGRDGGTSRSGFASVGAGLAANTSRCGDKPPSVPPDITMAICLADLRRCAIQVRSKSGLKRGHGIGPGKIVDAAVAFGLAEDRADVRCGDRRGGDHGSSTPEMSAGCAVGTRNTWHSRRRAFIGRSVGSNGLLFYSRLSLQCSSMAETESLVPGRSMRRVANAAHPRSSLASRSRPAHAPSDRL